MKTIIQRIILLSVLILPFFMIQKSSYPMVFSKSLFFESVTLLISALWIIGKLYKKDVGVISRNFISWVFGGYVLILLISGLSSFVPQLSFWGSFDHGLGVVFMLCLFIFTLITGAVFDRMESWYNVFSTISLSGILFSFGCLLSEFGVKFSKYLVLNTSNGFLIGNSSWTGIYVAFVFFISLGLVFSGRSKVQKFLGIMGALTSFFNPTLTGFLMQAPGAKFGFIGLAQTGSYSVLFGLGLFIIYIIFRNIKSEKFKKIFLKTTVSIVILGVIMFIFTGVPLAKRLIAEKAGPNRLVFWEIAIKGFKEKPILGWGSETYQFVYAKNFDPIVLTEGYAPEYWVDRSHNIFFDELVTGGIFGFVGLVAIYTIIFFGLFKKSIKDITKTGFLYIALFAGMVSFLVQGLMIFQTIIGWVIVGLLIAFSSNFCFKNKLNQIIEKKNKFKQKDNGANLFFSIIVLVIFYILFNFMVIKPNRINNLMGRFPAMDYKHRLEFLKELDNAYVGNTTDLGNLFAPYHVKLRRTLKNGLNDNEKQLMINEIKEINLVLENGLKRQDYKEMKLLMSSVGMHSILVALTQGSEQQDYFNKGMEYIEKMKIASPKNRVQDISVPILEYPFKYGEVGLDVLNLDNAKK